MDFKKFNNILKDKGGKILLSHVQNVFLRIQRFECMEKESNGSIIIQFHTNLYVCTVKSF